MITFVTSMFNGWRQDVYKPAHVQRLRDMIATHYKRPHRFICVSDKKIDGIDTVPIWDSPIKTLRGIPSSWFRLFLFSGQAIPIFGQRIVSIDLDVIITGNFTALFTNDPFKILKGVSNPYNGSLWQVTPGKYPELWTDLSLEVAQRANRQKAKNGRKFYGSDQAIMAFRLPGAPTWDDKDGIYQFTGQMPDDAKMIFFTGLHKPWNMQFSSLYWGGNPSNYG